MAMLSSRATFSNTAWETERSAVERQASFPCSFRPGIDVAVVGPGNGDKQLEIHALDQGSPTAGPVHGSIGTGPYKKSFVIRV